MTFAFTAAGTPKELIAEVGQQAANQQVPTGFADSINDQLGRLPEAAEVTISCNGHTAEPAGQLAGNITLQARIDWRVQATDAPQLIVDTDPEVQPGRERFPDGFEADAPPGPAADDAA